MVPSASRALADRESAALWCTACAQSPAQHGKRRKTQQILEEMARLEIEVENATIEVAVLQTLDDISTALTLSMGGAYKCAECE